MVQNEKSLNNFKIQILRAIAIFAVVMIHTYPNGQIGVIIRPFINFAVAMFVFLSGYLTNIKINNILLFYKKRILRVLIPYSIWSIIYTIAYGNYNDFIVNFFTARCCGIYYYIAVYIQLTLIAPLIIKLVNSKFRGVGWVITPAAIIVQYIMILAGKPISFPWSANNLFIWFIYYYIGILLGNNLIKYKINMAKTTIFLFICIAVQFFEAQLWYLYGDYGMATTQIKLTSMLTSIAVIFLSYSWMKIDSKQTGNKYILIIHKFLLITGDCSFGIYLSHVLVMYVLTKIFPLWNVLIFPLNSIFILMLTLLCVLTGRKILGKKLSKYMGLT